MRIGVLGSCRVKDPLRAAGVEVRTNSSIGHIHNPLEIIQALDMMDGLKVPPENLLDLLNLRYPERLARPVKAKVFVVEVSSIRLVQHRRWQLQIHRFRDMLQGYGVAPEELKILYEDMPRWRRRAKKLAEHLPERPAEILLRTRHREMEATEVGEALDVIADRLGAPVLFVGPITEAFGKAPPQRRLLADALADWGQRTGAPVLDPTPLVTDADLKDLGHYQPEAEARIGEVIAQAAAKLL